jgi:hypothetical protein
VRKIRDHIDEHGSLAAYAMEYGIAACAFFAALHTELLSIPRCSENLLQEAVLWCLEYNQLAQSCGDLVVDVAVDIGKALRVLPI